MFIATLHAEVTKKRLWCLEGVERHGRSWGWWGLQTGFLALLLCAAHMETVSFENGEMLTYSVSWDAGLMSADLPWVQTIVHKKARHSSCSNLWQPSCHRALLGSWLPTVFTTTPDHHGPSTLRSKWPQERIYGLILVSYFHGSAPSIFITSPTLEKCSCRTLTWSQGCHTW